MKLGNSQRGRSILITIIVVGLFAYTIFIGIKLAPEYMQFYSIKSSIDGLAQEMGSREINKSQFEDLMGRRLGINYIDLSDLSMSNNGCPCSKESVYIYNKQKTDVQVGIKYQKLVPLIANVDVVLKFEHTKTVVPPSLK
ncbi:MAG: DUF4845 domain-containing protein [Bacteroidota bacterium]